MGAFFYSVQYSTVLLVCILTVKQLRPEDLCSCMAFTLVDHPGQVNLLPSRFDTGAIVIFV